MSSPVLPTPPPPPAAPPPPPEQSAEDTQGAIEKDFDRLDSKQRSRNRLRIDRTAQPAVTKYKG